MNVDPKLIAVIRPVLSTAATDGRRLVNVSAGGLAMPTGVPVPSLTITVRTSWPPTSTDAADGSIEIDAGTGGGNGSFSPHAAHATSTTATFIRRTVRPSSNPVAMVADEVGDYGQHW